MGLPFHSMILVLVLTGCFLQQAIYEPPCDGVDGAVKRQVAKRSLQRSLNNQTSHYKTMLDLCENEMMSINFFFGIYTESTIHVMFLENNYRK